MEKFNSVEDMSISEEKGEAPQAQFSDAEYFNSYEDIEIHRLMVEDGPRTSAYKSAILENGHLFKGKTVMDVGAGTGILSLFAARAGARRVYAVEASRTAALITLVAAANGYSEIITVLHCKVEDAVLPNEEKVDVIISEWMGFYLLHESMLGSVLVARDRFLTDDGIVFPSEARIYACPCSLTQLYKEQIHFWNNVHGFDMSAVGLSAMDAKARKPEVCVVKPEELLSDPVCIKTINLRWMDAEEVADFSENVFVSITRSGTYHGICVWFECDFDGKDYNEDGEEFGKLLTLSTSPFSEPTHWKQTVVMLGKVGIVNSTAAQEDIENMNVNEEIIKESSNNGHGETLNKMNDTEASIEVNGQMKEVNCDIKSSKAYTDSDESNRAKEQFIELEKDEVMGWSLEFAQTAGNTRHYTITLQMLDPETDEHPEPCLCSMPRCLIIAKIIENELDGKTLGGEERVLAST